MAKKGKKKRHERKRAKREKPTAAQIIASHLRIKTGISDAVEADKQAQHIINDLSKFNYFIQGGDDD